MLYKLRHLCPRSVLRSLYYSLFNSHLTYGLPVWGTAKKALISKLEILQKKAIRAISFAEYSSPSSPIFKELGILTITDLYKTQTASLMWDLDHNTLPTSLSTYFTRVSETHSHNTRSTTSNKLKIKHYSTEKYGKQSFQVQGAIILNELKEQELYTTAITKKGSLKKFRDQILATY